ncbi:MAG TPA: lytic transglycosylase domain-containing protein [Solirubrobacteraceae bacterium]|nr:lytic transglycosylase domain-containing protein [Solirubrobacteraceae bacterium]
MSSAALRGRGAAAGGFGSKLALLATLTVAVAVLLALMLVAVLAGAGAAGPAGEAGGYGVSARARADIPPRYLALYQGAAARYRLDWAILAGIGKVECDHGRDPDPSCTKEGAVNAASAGGPMQFLAATFSHYGVKAEGSGAPDRWDPADAIYSAANYLRASGAPGDYRKAIFAYNHAGWYAAEVERWAAIYRGPSLAGGAGEGSGSEGPDGAWPGGSGVGLSAEGETDGIEFWPGVGPVRYTSGSRALLWRRDGHVALIPTEAPAVVQAMVIAGNELQELPYGASGHPDPRGADSEDCSSTVNYVLYRAGVRPIAEILSDNPLAQNYVDWGEAGPGRWVTIYATTAPTAHVFIVIAGLRLDTSHNGTDIGPNRDEDGPRWRILDRIPTWAHWSVRHPAGL